MVTKKMKIVYLTQEIWVTKEEKKRDNKYLPTDVLIVGRVDRPPKIFFPPPVGVHKNVVQSRL